MTNFDVGDIVEICPKQYSEFPSDCEPFFGFRARIINIYCSRFNDLCCDLHWLNYDKIINPVHRNDVKWSLLYFKKSISDTDLKCRKANDS